jgi:hypothetical protein
MEERALESWLLGIIQTTKLYIKTEKNVPWEEMRIVDIESMPVSIKPYLSSK